MRKWGLPTVSAATTPKVSSRISKGGNRWLYHFRVFGGKLKHDTRSLPCQPKQPPGLVGHQRDRVAQRRQAPGTGAPPSATIRPLIRVAASVARHGELNWQENSSMRSLSRESRFAEDALAALRGTSSPSPAANRMPICATKTSLAMAPPIRASIRQSKPSGPQHLAEGAPNAARPNRPWRRPVLVACVRELFRVVLFGLKVPEGRIIKARVGARRLINRASRRSRASASMGEPAFTPWATASA